MKLFIWRHNRTFHSYSMINEPTVHHDLYTDAVAIILAQSKQQALDLLASRHDGWLIEELRRLEPTVIACSEPTVVLAMTNGG